MNLILNSVAVKIFLSSDGIPPNYGEYSAQIQLL